MTMHRDTQARTKKTRIDVTYATRICHQQVPRHNPKLPHSNWDLKCLYDKPAVTRHFACSPDRKACTKDPISIRYSFDAYITIVVATSYMCV